MKMRLKGLELGEVALQLRGLAALTQDPGSVPSTHGTHNRLQHGWFVVTSAGV